MRVVDIAAVTPTGDRPDAFRLCEEWMRRQTAAPKQWIVVDDGLEPNPPRSPLVTDYVRREAGRNEPKHTLPLNLMAALPLVKTPFVAFFEDDEYYFPRYLEAMAEGLEGGADIVGQENSAYYRLPEREYKFCGNVSRASLCVTAMRAGCMEKLEYACGRCARTGAPFVDFSLWDSMVRSPKLLVKEMLHVGMKGMPGRRGTTSGWSDCRDGYVKDEGLEWLRSTVGDEVLAVYSEVMERHGIWKHGG